MAKHRINRYNVVAGIIGISTGLLALSVSAQTPQSTQSSQSTQPSASPTAKSALPVNDSTTAKPAATTAAPDTTGTAGGAAAPANASKIPPVPKGLDTQSSLPGQNGKATAPQSDKAIATMQKQAVALVQQKHYKEARDLYLQVLDRQEFVSGKNSKDLIGPLNDIVKTSCMAGACYDAMPQLQRLLDIKRATYGNNYADLPFNLQLMGEACEKKGKYAEALGYFNQAVEAQKRIGGSKNNLDIMLAINTGRALEHLNQKPAAKKLYLNLLNQAKQRNLSAGDSIYKAINARMAKLKGSTK